MHRQPTRRASIGCKNVRSVTPITERPAGSGILAHAGRGRASVMKTIFVVLVLAFAFTTGMAVTTIISQVVS
jgi:hypothetical protein